jgi:hypothetical protein
LCTPLDIRDDDARRNPFPSITVRIFVVLHVLSMFAAVETCSSIASRGVAMPPPFDLPARPSAGSRA